MQKCMFRGEGIGLASVISRRLHRRYDFVRNLRTSDARFRFTGHGRCSRPSKSCFLSRARLLSQSVRTSICLEGRPPIALYSSLAHRLPNRKTALGCRPHDLAVQENRTSVQGSGLRWNGDLRSIRQWGEVAPNPWSCFLRLVMFLWPSELIRGNYGHCGHFR